MKQLRWVLGATFVVACGFPRPPDIGPDDASGDGPGRPDTGCQLTAVTPSLGALDDVVTLEGTFTDPVMVTFPGGTPVLATVLGPHRATAIVPAAATSGDLSVSTCGATVGPVAFRRVSFAAGLGAFETTLDQSTGGHQNTVLVTARDSHASVLIGHQVYVVGGAGSSGALSTVERAGINADGTLLPFAIVPGVSLVTARQGHTAVVVGSYLYVIGGISAGSPLNSVERASIAADGSLGTFSTVSDVTLAVARQGHTSAVIGNYLYILGGFGANSLGSIERAIIQADGSLGTFAVVSGIALSTPRHHHATVVVGGYVYALGGIHGSGPLQDVERAPISADGSLGTFASASGSMLGTARSGHATLVLGGYLYVIGGIGTGNSLTSVERAPLAADGSLGAFANAAGVSLTSARHDHTAMVVGNYAYILGGSGSAQLSTVERASINVSGSLAAFAVVPGVSQVMARSGQSTVVVGRSLYVLGGVLTGPGSIERATIDEDGSLGPFTTVTNNALAVPRTGHTSAVIGNYVYVFGGTTAGFTTTNSIERALINPDGTLGTFAVVTGVNLVTARGGHTSAVLGGYLYIIGGFSGVSMPLAGLERAAISADGSLGPFFTVSGIALTTTRCGHASVVVGNNLYVLGGATCASVVNDPPLTTVERAVIGSDGSLGTFSNVSVAPMNTGRENFATSIVGSYLYAVGGAGSPGLKTLERAPINTDGTLGAFVTSGGTLTTGRYLEQLVIVGNSLYVVGGSQNTVEQAILASGAP